MAMLQRFGRLFTIKTRWEAWAVIYAIALGAVERARHYLEVYPGATGWMLALACTGVVFLAGAKLLDAVRPAPATVAPGPYAPVLRQARRVSRSRPRQRQIRRAAGSPISSRTD